MLAGGTLYELKTEKAADRKHTHLMELFVDKAGRLGEPVSTLLDVHGQLY